MNLSEALEEARRRREAERLGVDLDETADVPPADEASPLDTRRCPACQTEGWPEIIDLVRGVVDMRCPSCTFRWRANRSAIPTA